MSGKFALIIANTEYTDSGLAQLTAPGKDAEDFARVLGDPNICAFDDVKVLLNEPEPIVRDGVFEFFNTKGRDDLLLMYFSGHGVRDEFGALHLAVKNTKRDRLHVTAIGSDFVSKLMDQCRSKRQILILDCCNSGAFNDGAKAAIGGNMGIFDTFVSREGYGRVVLTATNSIQFAWEGKKIDEMLGEKTENSLFTHFLVKGLKGEADIDGDGRITIDELYKYSSDQVAGLAPLQKPQKKANFEEGEIVLRQNIPFSEIPAKTLPEYLSDNTKSRDPEVRLLAVSQLKEMLNSRNLGKARAAREALEKIAAEDDSRRVMQAASKALEPMRQAEQIALQNANKPLDAERAETEERIKQESEQKSNEIRRIKKRGKQPPAPSVKERNAVAETVNDGANRFADLKVEEEQQARKEVGAEPNPLKVVKKFYSVPADSEPFGESQNRILEAAIEKEVKVGKATQLFVLVRRLEAKGIISVVNSIDEEVLLDDSDIKSREVQIEFPIENGKVSSARITLRLTAQDFSPANQERYVLIPPNGDSEITTFMITPKIAGRLTIQLEVLKEELSLAFRTIRTTAINDDVPKNAVSLFTIPIFVFAQNPGFVASHSESQLPTQVPEISQEAEQKMEEKRRVKEETERLARLKAEEERLRIEKAETEHKKRGEAEKLLQAQAEQETANREAARLKAEREAAESAARESAEKAAREKAKRAAAEREAMELASRRRAQQEAPEKAAQQATKTVNSRSTSQLSIAKWAMIGAIGLCGIAIAAAGIWYLASHVPTPPTAIPATQAPDIILSDDFSKKKWGTGTDADSSIEYATNILQMIVFTKKFFVWSTPNAENYQNIHMEATVINNGTDSTTAFGIMCNKQGSTNNYHYFAITPAGKYAIAKATTDQNDLFLTNNDQWASSDAIAKNAASYRVGADCRSDGTLTLYVDGQEIASVSDVSYTSGGVALFTWSGEEATTTNVSFDDFLMTKLP